MLCFAFVILLTLGVWYVNDDRRCDDDSSGEVIENIVKVCKLKCSFTTVLARLKSGDAVRATKAVNYRK